MPAKSDDDDRKKLASDASETLGPIMKQSEKAFKMCAMVAKQPNPKMMEGLADLIEDIVKDSDDLKKMLKDIKAACK